MVVGDRLWLFSQTPNGPAPVQSMMLNNSPTMSIPPLHPSMRGFPSPSNSPIMDMNSRGPLIPRSQPLPYGMSKPLSPYSTITNASFINRMSPHFKPYETFKYRTPGSLRNGDYAPNKPMNSLYKTDAIPDQSYYQLKYVPNSCGNSIGPSNGLAELERAFGGERNQLLDGTKGSSDALLKEERRDSDGSSSEIDCEEID